MLQVAHSVPNKKKITTCKKNRYYISVWRIFNVIITIRMAIVNLVVNPTVGFNCLWINPLKQTFVLTPVVVCSKPAVDSILYSIGIVISSLAARLDTF